MQTSGFAVVTYLTYDTVRGVVTCLLQGGPVTNITWNKTGLTSTALLNNELLIYQNNLTITGTNISVYTGIFSCTVSMAVIVTLSKARFQAHTLS